MKKDFYLVIIFIIASFTPTFTQSINFKADNKLRIESNSGQYESGVKYVLNTKNYLIRFYDYGIYLFDKIPSKSIKEDDTIILKSIIHLPKNTFYYSPVNETYYENKVLKGSLKTNNVKFCEELNIFDSKGIKLLSFKYDSENLQIGANRNEPTLNIEKFQSDYSGESDKIISDLTKKAINGSPLSDQIDLSWSTYFGGKSTDIITGVTFDEKGNVLITACTQSSDFYLKDSKNGVYKGDYDIAVSKLTPQGELIWSTLIGGKGEEGPFKIAFDKNTKRIWVAGQTASDDWPLTSNAFQKKHDTHDDGCIFQLDSIGNLLFSTYLGGNSYDAFTGLALDKDGNFWGCGRTDSYGFPTTADAMEPTHIGDYDAFIVNVSKNYELVYSSYVGSKVNDSGDNIAVDNNGNPIFVGYTSSNSLFGSQNSGLSDAWVFKMNAKDHSIVFSKLFGGYASEIAYDLLIDPDNNTYIKGNTSSKDFPVTKSAIKNFNNGYLDYFIMKIDTVGNILWSTYFGGGGVDGVNAFNTYHSGLCFNASGDIVSGGTSSSSDLPVTKYAFQKNIKGDFDAFVSIFTPNGALKYCSYFGGTGFENIYDLNYCSTGLLLVGMTNSADFPTKAPLQAKNAGGYDGFIVKFGIQTIPDTISINIKNFDCTPYTVIVASNNSIADVKATNQSNCNLSFEYNIWRDTVICSVTIVNAALGAYVDLLASTIDGKTSNYHYDFPPAGMGAIAWNFASKDSVVKFDTNAIAVQTCKTINIYNKFESPLVFKDAYLLGDTAFSFPHYQLPLTVQAKDSAEFILCFTPKNNTKKAQKDTLILALQCQKMIVPMVGPTTELDLEGESNCGVFVRIRGDKASPISKFTAISDPAGIVLSIQTRRDIDDAQVKLYDLDGQEKFELYSGKISSGDFSRIALCPGLQTGVYMIRLEYEDNIEVVKLLNTK